MHVTMIGQKNKKNAYHMKGKNWKNFYHMKLNVHKFDKKVTI
jgi:hypothetical protein